MALPSKSALHFFIIVIPWLNAHTPFPSPNLALAEPNGLLAAGGDLSPQRLIDAYSKGIFPWYNDNDPILWWSPNPRMVLFPDELKVSRSLRKTLRKNLFNVTSDSAFDRVIAACAATRDDGFGTWINPAIQSAYCALHKLGIAHSIEAWQNDALVGGLYGVALGKMFFGESMFSLTDDASKVAFVHLINHLKKAGFGMIDCQMKTAHLASLGAREISREVFSHKLQEWVNCEHVSGKWRLDAI